MIGKVKKENPYTVVFRCEHCGKNQFARNVACDNQYQMWWENQESLHKHLEKCKRMFGIKCRFCGKRLEFENITIESE